MGAVVALFGKREGEAPRRPLAEQEGLRLPERFDFRDLKEFLEAIAPEPRAGDRR